MNSLRNKILKYLEAWHKLDPTHWTHKGKLELEAKAKGYLGDCCTRRLRELQRDNLIEVRYAGKSGSAEYRFIPQVLSVVNFTHEGEAYQLVSYVDQLETR